MVIGNFGLSGANNAYQAGFSHVGETNQPHIRQKLQFKSNVKLFSRKTGFCEARYLPCRGGEVHISFSALSPLGDNNRLVSRNIRYYSACFGIFYDGSSGYVYYHVGSRLAAAPLSPAVLTVFGVVLSFVAEIDQRGKVVVGAKQYRAAPSSVAAVRTARRDVFFTVEAYRTIAAVSRLK